MYLGCERIPKRSSSLILILVSDLKFMSKEYKSKGGIDVIQDQVDVYIFVDLHVDSVSKLHWVNNKSTFNL